MWRAGSLALTPPHIGTTPYTLSNVERERERVGVLCPTLYCLTHTHVSEDLAWEMGQSS